jgi:hypothetical protein
MQRTMPLDVPFAALLALALVAPQAALAYDEKDAIADCESHIRSEYGLSDMRDAHAVQVPDSDKHYKVEGKSKVEGDKYPWTCEVKNRHVVAAEYHGKKPEGLSTAQKIAIGAGAVAAVGIAAQQLGKQHEGGQTQAGGYDAGSISHRGDYADGNAGGPDYWEVSGVPAGDLLNIRRGPSAHDPLVMGVVNGTRVQNRGCQEHAGQRWCHIALRDDPGVQGWVNAHYLRESSR